MVPVLKRVATSNPASDAASSGERRSMVRRRTALARALPLTAEGAAAPFSREKPGRRTAGDGLEAGRLRSRRTRPKRNRAPLRKVGIPADQTGRPHEANYEMAGGRYVRRDAKGRIKESDNVSRSLSQDRRKTAKIKVKAGQGGRGDRKPVNSKARRQSSARK